MSRSTWKASKNFEDRRERAFVASGAVCCCVCNGDGRVGSVSVRMERTINRPWKDLMRGDGGWV